MTGITSQEKSELEIEREIEKHLKESNLDLADFLLNLSRKWENRINNAGGNGEWMSDAIVVTKRAIATLSPQHPALRERHIALSALFARRSTWMSLPDASSDLDKAIRYEEWACQLSMQTLSGLYEERFERHQQHSDLQKAVHILEQSERLLPAEDKGANRSNVATLRFKQHQTAISCILEVPFTAISTKPISLSHAPKSRFRFVDCRALVNRASLRIVELKDLPKKRYVAISYPWQGLEPLVNAGTPSPMMTIHGADDADPVSIDVLSMACKSALRLKCELLWFDGLCIKQDDVEDKSWQIQRMYDVYKYCRECLVIPGGLSRLAEIDEETNWINRAWTLQEVIAPESCTVLFAWTEGNATLKTTFYCSIQEVEEGKAGMTSLRNLLMISIPSSASLHFDYSHEPPTNFRGQGRVSVKILGDRKSPRMALLGALDHKNSQEGLANAVWRSAMMRAASRPVDMIFSIMGLLGVTLDPSHFGVNEKTKATIALMQAYVHAGGRAEWLGISPTMPINQEISTMPVFARSSMSGKPMIETKDGEKDVTEMISDVSWKLVGAPKGTVSDDGYFKFKAKAASVRMIRDGANIEDDAVLFDSVGKKTWAVFHNSGNGSTFAVFIGTKETYSNGAIARSVNPWKFLVMLVEEHVPGRFHNIGYAFVRQEVLDADGWLEREFDVGSSRKALV